MLRRPGRCTAAPRKNYWMCISRCNVAGGRGTGSNRDLARMRLRRTPPTRRDCLCTLGPSRLLHRQRRNIISLLLIRCSSRGATTAAHHELALATGGGALGSSRCHGCACAVERNPRKPAPEPRSGRTSFGCPRTHAALRSLSTKRTAAYQTTAPLSRTWPGATESGTRRYSETSVYHVTDVPRVLTTDTILVLDPHVKYLAPYATCGHPRARIISRCGGGGAEGGEGDAVAQAKERGWDASKAMYSAAADDDKAGNQFEGPGQRLGWRLSQFIKTLLFCKCRVCRCGLSCWPAYACGTHDHGSIRRSARGPHPEAGAHDYKFSH